MKPYSSHRRDSGSSEHDLLTVESAILHGRASSMGGGVVPVGTNQQRLGVGNLSHNLIVGSSLLNKNGVPGSMSSGCASDGSTDSLLEQDLHNLSLAVTQQALE